MGSPIATEGKRQFPWIFGCPFTQWFLLGSGICGGIFLGKDKVRETLLEFVEANNQHFSFSSTNP